VTEYDELAEVYEWLISDAKLPPAEFAASFDDVLSLLPPNARRYLSSEGTVVAGVCRVDHSTRSNVSWLVVTEAHQSCSPATTNHIFSSRSFSSLPV
jgi:hypothetical protein